MNLEQIKSALAEIQTGDLLEKSKDLLSLLGYRGDLTLELSGTVDDFIEQFPAPNPNSKTNNIFVITPNPHTSSFNLPKMKS